MQLTDLEYRMLRELSVYAGEVLSYDHLLLRVWGRRTPATCGRCAPS